MLHNRYVAKFTFLVHHDAITIQHHQWAPRGPKHKITQKKASSDPRGTRIRYVGAWFDDRFSLTTKKRACWRQIVGLASWLGFGLEFRAGERQFKWLMISFFMWWMMDLIGPKLTRSMLKKTNKVSLKALLVHWHLLSSTLSRMENLANLSTARSRFRFASKRGTRLWLLIGEFQCISWGSNWFSHWTK